MSARVVTALLFPALFLALPGPRKTEVVVPENSTALRLAGQLASSGVLVRKRLFLAVTALTGADRSLKYGTYRFYRNSPIYNIVQELSRGRGVLVKVTIPEGFRSGQIAGRLSAEGIVGRDEFMRYVSSRGLEGYLFPETYYFTPGETPEKVCDAFGREFDSVYSDEISTAAAARGMSKKDVVILASIIEKEAKERDEKFLISGIFHNRLRKRMRLESCATVRFAIKKWRGPLSIKDTFFKSPYNTYRHWGLPPDPICNPGRDSLLAAVNPTGTDLMFFVVDKYGRHNFSKYFSQHRRKKFRREKGLSEE